MLTGGYLPGDSALHRAPPSAKFAALAVFTVLVFFVGGWWVVLPAAGLVAALYRVAGASARLAWAQVWPLRWFLAVLFPVQVWSAGWGTAWLVCGNLVVAVAGASLITLTTRVDDLRSAAEAGLRRVRLPGVDAERAGLALALTLRSIPVLVGITRDVREAACARGLERDPRAYLVPVLVRAIRHAERVGDALAARGVDD